MHGAYLLASGNKLQGHESYICSFIFKIENKNKNSHHLISRVHPIEKQFTSPRHLEETVHLEIKI